MKTNLLIIAHDPLLRSGYIYGKWRAGHMHVSTTRRQQVRSVVQSMSMRTRETGGRINGMLRNRRDYRRAVYAGQLAALRAERRLMAAFSL